MTVFGTTRGTLREIERLEPPRDFASTVSVIANVATIAKRTATRAA
ncbi:hypothetical protein AU106_gp026 [Sinorhizobium phage phiM9]|uniref:Uncharacterized protein n=1 Tax=Sinorhizobium phage phiM9 TaxID=1636182 RepID=A0A0F6R4V1_9CAUD|nr:hypothetical protein AU106_gp026 [Sinorhizobium phage phiM9]AKE44657.1 hypothetical protein Sm_phiM9_027 [Sinorhizobium phage phiM9]